MRFSLFLILFFSLSANAVPNAVEAVLKSPVDTPAPAFKPSIFVPVVYFTPETKFGGGLLHIKNFSQASTGRVSHLTMAATYTQLKQYNALFAPTFYFDGRKHELSANIFFLHFPNKYFGKSSDVITDPEIYSEDSTSAFFNYGYRFYKDFVIRSSFGRDWRTITQSNNAPNIQNEIKSGFGKYSLNDFGLSIEWDDRDFPLAPYKGSWYKIGYQKYWDAYASKPIQFEQLDLDLRYYLPTGRKQLLASQFYLGEVNGGNVPFQYYQLIGGPNRLRGYYNGRYRDHAVGLFQLEFRRDVSPRWSVAVFTGIAKLAPAIAELSPSPFHISSGVGLHLIIDQASRAKIRFDIGIGEDGSRGAYVITNEAF